MARPLPLAAGQRGERLADGHVAEPDVGEPVEDLVGGRRARLARAEELLGLGHRHREHLADVAAAEVVVQHAGWNRFPSHSSQMVVTLAMMPRSVSMTPAPLRVGQAPSELRLNGADHAVRLGERLADRIEQTGVRRRVGPP